MYVSRHVQFNPNEFPYPTLFSSSSLSPPFQSHGFSTAFLEPFSSISNSLRCPQVAQFPVQAQSPTVSSDTCASLPSPSIVLPIFSLTINQLPAFSVLLPQPKPISTPFVHPMITRSKSKQPIVSSPNALISSIEPSSVREALLDSRWVKAMEQKYLALQHNVT